MFSMIPVTCNEIDSNQLLPCAIITQNILLSTIVFHAIEMISYEYNSLGCVFDAHCTEIIRRWCQRWK